MVGDHLGRTVHETVDTLLIEGADFLALDYELGEVPEISDVLEMEIDPIDRRSEICTSESCGACTLKRVERTNIA